MDINLNVDNRIVTISKKLFSKRGAFAFMTFLLIMSTIMLQGSQIAKRYDFIVDTEINPDEVNANFDDLYAKVNELDNASWTRSGNDLVYTGGNVKIGSGYSLKDGNGTTLNGYITTGVGGFPSDSAIRLKVIEIGDWDMDASSGINKAHGLTWTNIINLWAIIRNDSDRSRAMLILSSAGASSGYSKIVCSETNITIYREIGGSFDNTRYDATSYNRGWIFIQYI